MKNLAYLLVVLIAIVGCRKETIIAGGDDWTTDTHNSSTPNYSVVFDDSKVHRIDITITADNWTLMQDNLDDIYGGASTPGSFSEETPVYVPCEYYYNGIEWYNVGIRYKGNSSLQSAYTSGNGKLPLRLAFDKFEDEYPEITGQDFYGFTELSMSSNYNDESVMREKAASDLFKEFDVPCAITAFYRVYIDFGEGSQYFGLYTMLEIVFDTALDNSFNSNTGNCYKPDGDAASFASGTYDETELEIKNGGSDWSDIEAMYNAIHSTERTTNPSAWRSDLESIFDVDGFLKYMAVNNTIQNWDTYGRMTHNYYMYNDPSDNKLHWIPWDNNEAFQDGKMGGAMQIDGSDIDSEWPLVNYILSDATYEAQYKVHLRDFVDNHFNSSMMTNRYNGYYSLIEQYVVGSDGEDSGYSFVSGTSGFSTALSDLISHVSQRTVIVNAYAP